MIGNFSLVHLLVLLPLGAAIASLAGVPAPRRVAFAAASVNVLLLLVLAIPFKSGLAEPQYFNKIVLVESWGFSYSVGLDGLSLVMAGLATLVTLAAIWASRDPHAQPSLYFACLMLLSAGAIGAFVSFDLIFFYAFHELALVPTFLLIGVWGSGDRKLNAWRITIYLGLA